MASTLLTKKEAAEALGVSVKTIERRLSKGLLTREIVHGPHGPEVRVVFPATPDVTDATFTVAPATNVVPFRPGGVPPVEGVAPSTPPSTELAAIVPAMLRALDERQREVEGWAVRAGRAEAERDALRAEVESLRRPWWRKLLDKRGEGSDA